MANHKWKRYEQALLVAMGYNHFSTNAQTAQYQLLIIPTFHAPCCLRLVLASQKGELSFCLLLEHSAELFYAIWREDTEAEVQALGLARQSCLEDLSELNVEQVAILREHIAALEPMLLDDINLASRDGVSIRCDCYDGSRQHSVSMRSPTVEEAPRHRELITVVLEAAQKQFEHQQIQEYLASIGKYF